MQNFLMWGVRNHEACKFLGNFIPLIKTIANILSQKLACIYYQCLEFAIAAHLKCSVLLTLALKTRTCSMTLLVPA